MYLEGVFSVEREYPNEDGTVDGLGLRAGAHGEESRSETYLTDEHGYYNPNPTAIVFLRSDLACPENAGADPTCWVRSRAIGRGHLFTRQVQGLAPSGPMAQSSYALPRDRL